jgi:hypothetical protein
MRIFAAIVVTAVLSIGASVGITHSVMQDQHKREVDRAKVESFNDGFRDGSCRDGEDGFDNPCMEAPAALPMVTVAKGRTTGYRVQVITGTYLYGPCKGMRQSKAGRAMYWDMIADSTDEGKRRSVKSQVRYVKQGCRNGA